MEELDDKDKNIFFRKLTKKLINKICCNKKILYFYEKLNIMSTEKEAKLKALKKRLDNGLIPEGTEGVMEQITNVTKKIMISFARMGTYGEPTLLPFELLEQIRPLVGKVSGYTHQWHKPENKQYAKYLMASTHNIFDVKLAEGLGFRSYNASQVEGAILYPSAPTIAKEKQVSCAKCGLCEGGKKAKNIYNVIH